MTVPTPRGPHWCFVWPAVLWTSETDYGVCRAQLWPRLIKASHFRFQKITGPKSIQRWNKVTKSVFFYWRCVCFLFFLEGIQRCCSQNFRKCKRRFMMVVYGDILFADLMVQRCICCIALKSSKLSVSLVLRIWSCHPPSRTFNKGPGLVDIEKSNRWHDCGETGNVDHTCTRTHSIHVYLYTYIHHKDQPFI